MLNTLKNAQNRFQFQNFAILLHCFLTQGYFDSFEEYIEYENKIFDGFFNQTDFWFCH
jgi:hypothetical protein